jgi:hypothetical protein
MNATQRVSYSVSFLAIACALFGCSREPASARYTVEEYLGNPQAMDAKLKECANSPGDLRSDPDCINANAAAERKGIGSLRDLPPMGLNPSEKDAHTDETESTPRDSQVTH